MKVAPKSSLRPFLHRALHLFASFSIVGRTLTEKDCPVFKHPLIICVAGFSISSPKVSQTEVTANCCGKNRELHKLTHSGECLDARVKKRLGRKVNVWGRETWRRGRVSRTSPSIYSWFLILSVSPLHKRPTWRRNE